MIITSLMIFMLACMINAGAVLVKRSDGLLLRQDRTPDTEDGTLTPDNDGPYSMAYYPDWVGLEPDDVDFSLFDWIDFAFAIPTSSFGLSWEDDSAPALLKRIIDAAHKENTKVKLSIGGWTGSKHFSGAVATAESRSTFVKHIVALYKKMGVDGVDIDWEYPGQKGAGNKFSADDTSNYLLFLRSLRKALPSGAKITAAVTPEPWVDITGSPAKDVKEFAEVLDWVLLMVYDTNVPGQDFPGPNAPLRDACGNAKRPMASAEGGLKAWKEAGFPAHKIALGIAAYGYVHKSSAKKLEMRRKIARQVGDIEEEETNQGASGDGILKPDSEGQIQFVSLIEQGALSSSFKKGSNGFIRHWDRCSLTPFLISDDTLVSYDDPYSLKMKGKYAKKHGMIGLGMWDIHGDTKDWALTKAAREGLGLSSASSGIKEGNFEDGNPAGIEEIKENALETPDTENTIQYM